MQEFWLSSIDTMLTSVFLMEFLMKTVALGFVMHRGSYLQDSWNRLDFLVVCVSIVALVAEFGLVGGDVGDTLNSAQSLHALRGLRPLRAVKFMPALRMILDAISISAGRMKDVMLLALFFFVIYGIIGMQMFGGALRRRCAYANPFEPT